MDEAENKANEQQSAPPPKTSESARDIAVGMAEDIRADAEKTLQKIKGRNFRDFFGFDKLIFPGIARIVFVAFTIAMLLIGVLGALAGFASMGEIGFLSGLSTVFISVFTAIFMIILARIWIEIVLVAFKIHDGIRDIKEILAERLPR